MDQRNNVKSLVATVGRFSLISISLLFLLLLASILTPSRLIALTHDETYNQMTSLLSSIQDKSELFKNQVDKYIGIPYRRGGTGEKGFDCSGFVRQVYSEFFGLELPHQSGSQSSLPFMQKISKDELVTGDLVFFTTGKKQKRINHVGIYLSDGQFIHAAKGGVTVSSLDSSYWKARFFVAKRVGTSNVLDRLDTDEKSDSLPPLSDFTFGSRFDLLTDLTASPSALESYNNYKDYPNDSLSMGYEITWSTSIANGLISPKITAYQDYYRPRQLNLFDNISTPINEFGLASATNRSSDQGMNLTAAFASNDKTLSLTPSLAYFDSGYDTENKRLQRLTYGLNLEISPVNQPWLLAFGMQFSDYTYSNYASANTVLNEFRSPLNMSFTYLHQLSKSAYLTFKGEVVQRYEPPSEAGGLNQWKDERRSMFLFNYKY